MKLPEILQDQIYLGWCLVVLSTVAAFLSVGITIYDAQAAEASRNAIVYALNGDEFFSEANATLVLKRIHEGLGNKIASSSIDTVIPRSAYASYLFLNSEDFFSKRDATSTRELMTKYFAQASQQIHSPEDFLARFPNGSTSIQDKYIKLVEEYRQDSANETLLLKFLVLVLVVNFFLVFFYTRINTKNNRNTFKAIQK